VTWGSAATAFGLMLFGYLVGSLSPSVWLGKTLKGIDVRRQGSGNAGTTNAFRVLGIKVGLAVLILDVLKGIVPVVVARLVLHDAHPGVVVLVGFACILGHNYSLFLRGKGGKGVATGAGAAVAMMPVPMAIVVALFVVLVLLTRIVSLASIVCTIMFPVMAVAFGQPLAYILGACVMAAVVLWAHRGNLRRLWRREEPRVKFPWNKEPGGDDAPDERAVHEASRQDSGAAAM